MRYDLKREYEFKPAWLVLAVVIGAGIALIDEGFEIWMLPVIGALAIFWTLVFEGGFWKNNYAIFHEDHFDVSHVPWGAGKVYLRLRTWPIKMSIPYASVADLRIAENGEVEVDIDTNTLPLAKFGAQITVMFRPREIMGAINELRSRVETARSKIQTAGHQSNLP